MKITADEVCDLLAKEPTSSKRVFWRNLISGQLDADRADYLLRDSYHAGVNYGKYDLKRILRTLTVVKDPETENFFIGIDKSGWHAAEGLIKEGKAGLHGETILNRLHYRRAYETKEVPDINDLNEFEAIYAKFKNDIGFVDHAEKSWYKTGDEDIPIIEESNGSKWIPLSEYSSIVKNLAPCKQIRIYVPYENRKELRKKIDEYREEIRNGE